MVEKYKVVGKHPDGVRILAPRTKPEHFTNREIGRSIERVVNRDSRDGRFTEGANKPTVSSDGRRKRG